jgi:hypothetical protein
MIPAEITMKSDTDLKWSLVDCAARLSSALTAQTVSFEAYGDSVISLSLMELQMDTMEQRIRDRAHKLWEEEGRPEGRAEMHWAQARALVASQDGLPRPKPKVAAKKMKKKTH